MINNKNKTLKRKRKQLIPTIIWDILVNKNIKIVFGVPSSSMDLILNYIPKQIQWINVGIELQNGFISQVYGSLTDNVGILFVGTGPGIATAFSAIKNAESENKPMLIITSYIKKNENNLQYWDIEKVSKTIVNHVFVVKKSSQLKEMLLLAYETAKINSTGVIFIIDEDVLSENKETLTILNKNVVNQHEPSEYFLNKTIKDLSKLNNTKLLVVIGTTNFKSDYTYIYDFIKKNNVPYVTTWKARTIYNSGLYCGRVGSLGNHSANYALYKCDNILIIGTMVENLRYNDKEFHYDLFSIPLITKNKSIYIINYKNNSILSNTKLYIYKNLKYILNKINIQVNNDWLTQLNKSTSVLLFDLPKISLLEKYAFIASNIYNLHKLDIPVTTGVGNHWYAIGKYMKINNPYSWESDCNWVSIGVGIAHGIGMYYATKKPVWVFEGDGGIIFSANNLIYLLNHMDLPITVTIFINHIYGAIVSSYIIKGLDPKNVTNNVENNFFLSMLPNSYIFEDLEKYYDFLNKNPISHKLRFIIINLGKKPESSNVYEINLNEKYQHYLKNDMFNEIINSKLVLFENKN